MRRQLSVLALLGASLGGALLANAPAEAQEFADDAKSDPLDELRAPMEELDRLMDAGRTDDAIAKARERAKDGSAAGQYLLGHALGSAAIRRSLAQYKEKLAGWRPGSDKPRPKREFDSEGSALLDGARESYERSNEAGGLLYAPAHFGLAHVSFVKDDFDGGIAELRKALAISRNFKQATLVLAQALWGRNLESDAAFVVHQFLEVRPNDADARILLGLFKNEKGRFAEAEPEFRKALSAEPDNLSARRELAKCLMHQEKFAESAEHFEIARRADPKDDESAMFLFHEYVRLRKHDQAVGVLTDLAAALPGTEQARRANSLLAQLKENPNAFDRPERVSAQELIDRLKSSDPAVVQATLEKLREYRLPAMPAEVGRLLDPRVAPPSQRIAAVRLYGDTKLPQALTIFEIMLFHPTDRDPDAGVRREVALALAGLPTDAAVPIFFELLDDPDPDVRESAVQGIASRTGKWFRDVLAERTPEADWPAQREAYRRWWTSSSSSAAKRSAAAALAPLYARVDSSGAKLRVARFALPILDDPIESTWRAGYELFRALTFVTFGSESGFVDEAARRRIAGEARTWLEQKTAKR